MEKTNNSSEIFARHFGDTAAVNLNHPNIEAFFNDVQADCEREDRIRAKTIKTVLIFVEMENGNIHQVLADKDSKDAALHLLRINNTLRLSEEIEPFTIQS